MVARDHDNQLKIAYFAKHGNLYKKDRRLISRRIEQFQSGNFTLTGQWDGPMTAADDDIMLPGVIFVHGFTGNRMESRRMYARLSAQLAKKGVYTFRFDHRGCGESEGDFRDFDADGLLADLDSALKVFETNKRIDPSRTAVVGYSLGGLSASYLLKQRPDFLTAVLWAPVARPDIIRERLSGYPDFHNYHTKGYFDYMGFRVSAEYFDNIVKLNPVSWVESYKPGILICQGTDDPIVKPEQAERYMAERKNPADELVMVAGGDHFFGSADNIDNVLAKSEKWLLDKLA